MSEPSANSNPSAAALDQKGTAAQDGVTVEPLPKESPSEGSAEYPREEEPQNGTLPNEPLKGDVSPKELSLKDLSPKELSLKDVCPKESSPKGESPKELSLKDLSPKELSLKDVCPKESSPKGDSPRELSLKDELLNDDPCHALSSCDFAQRDESAHDDGRREDTDFSALEHRAHEALEHLAANGANAAAGEDGEACIAAYSETLREYRHACQVRALYMEADLVQQVLCHLRLDEETRHVRGLTEQQMQERQALEDAHREQFQRFHSTWNARIDELEEKQVELETALIERQNEELQAFYNEMGGLTPHSSHASRGLIHTRAVEHILAAQRQYAQAHRTKLRADRLEARDTERFMQAKVEVFERREAVLRQKHQQERNVLGMKTERRRVELERARKRELDVLLRRYVNVRRELELQQNIIRNKTGTILLKHANNTKSDASGSAALVESAGSGAFGLTVRRRHMDESASRSFPQSITPR